MAKAYPTQTDGQASHAGRETPQAEAQRKMGGLASYKRAPIQTAKTEIGGQTPIDETQTPGNRRPRAQTEGQKGQAAGPRQSQEARLTAKARQAGRASQAKKEPCARGRRRHAVRRHVQQSHSPEALTLREKAVSPETSAQTPIKGCAFGPAAISHTGPPPAITSAISETAYQRDKSI